MRIHTRAASAGLRIAPALVLAGLTACSAFRAPLSREVQGANDFRLLEDDGRNAVWSVSPLDRSEGRAWMDLLVSERKRVEDFFATSVDGRVSLWLVDVLPGRFDGDAFSEGKDIYLRLATNRRPSPGDESLVAHEMTHVVLHEAFGMERPFWFEEGLATYLEGSRLGFGAGGRDLLSGAEGLSGLDAAGLTLGNVARVGNPLAYRLSGAAIELIIEKHGVSAVRRLQREPAGRSFDDGYFRVTGETIEGLERRWREEIRAAIRLRVARG